MADMYGIEFRPRGEDPLGEERLIVFEAEAGNKGVSGAKEKNTQDPREDGKAYGWRLELHGTGAARLEKEMVANVRARSERTVSGGVTAFGRMIASQSSVKASMGQRSKDSSNESVEALKPLARNTVYTFAARGMR